MNERRDISRRAFWGAAEATARPAGSEEPALPQSDGRHVQVSRQAMGCTWAALFPAAPGSGAIQAGVEALDLVEAIEAQLTVYRETSEVAHVNRTAGDGWVVVSPQLFDLLERSLHLHAATAGALDVAAGALVRAWGIGRRQGRVPTADEVTAALAQSGSAGIELDAERRAVRFARPGLLNFGAVGKGYALDRCAAHLDAAGVPNYLMHGGRSSVIARGRDGAGAGWTIGLGDPLRPGERLGTVTLVNEALATSGAGTQFFRHGGKRYGHILDPRTGLPAEGVLSTTVVAPDGTLAEALSTAFYVLGSEGAQRYCQEHPDVGAIVVLPGGGPQGLRVVTCNLDAMRWELAPGLAR